MIHNQPLTIGSLRDEHLSLMRRWRDIADDEQRVRQALALRETIAAAGQWIEGPVERDEAQGLIDYWASAIAGLEGQGYPPLVSVASFVDTQARATAKPLRQAYEALYPAESQRLARSVLEDLLTASNGKVERDKPRTRQALSKSAGADTQADLFGRVLTEMVATGAIVHRPGNTPADDYFEALDGRVADGWPELLQWLSAAEGYNIERTRLMEVAQKWRASGKDKTLLLPTNWAVDDALSFKGEDDLLDEFIMASHDARRRWRRVTLALSALAVVALGLALVHYFRLEKKARDDRDVAKKEMITAVREKLEAQKELAEARAFNAEAQANAEIAQSPEALSKEELGKVVEGISPAADFSADHMLEKVPAVLGAMWLGSNKTPQVSDVRGGRVDDFEKASAGTRYRARVPIFLRAAMPNSNKSYALSKQKAAIPAGAQIILLGKPRGYDRSTGTQFWANVRIVPQVYVQYNNVSLASVDRLRRKIADSGFEVPKGELRRDFRGGGEVRYFQPEDRPVAALLQTILNSSSESLVGKPVACRSFTGSSSIGTNFKLEYWFDGRAPVSDAQAPPCD